MSLCAAHCCLDWSHATVLAIILFKPLALAMARVDQLPKGAVTPLRLVLVLIFLLSLTGFVLYFFAVPLRMLYWGGEICPGASLLMHPIAGRCNCSQCIRFTRPSCSLRAGEAHGVGG